MFDRSGSLKEWYARVRNWARGLKAVRGGEACPGPEQTLTRLNQDLDHLLAQAEAFHRSVSQMKELSGELERLRGHAGCGTDSAGRHARGFLFAADKIGNLAQHSKTNIEEALEQLTLFAEIMRGLSRDFQNSVRHIDENLGAFRELNALLSDRWPAGTKEEREATDRM